MIKLFAAAAIATLLPHNSAATYAPVNITGTRNGAGVMSTAVPKTYIWFKPAYIFAIYSGQHGTEPMITISANGHIYVNPKVKPDAAAKKFIEALRQQWPAAMGCKKP